MSNTPNLSLPYLAAGQAQKHVTLNEALRMLDALVQLSVFSRGLTTPPASPANGQSYIVPAGATGSWSGQTGKIAAFQDGVWMLYAAVEGWTAWVRDEDKLYAFDGAAWIVAGGAIQNQPFVGVNATADTTNRLAVSAPATLLNHEGAGHQLKLNKAAAAQTASILFQTGFSGRAELGTAGTDTFSFKVSADGSAWANALNIASDGKIGIGGVTNPSVALHAPGAVRVGSYTVAGLPSAATSGAGAMVHVSNEVGGAVLAFSDGTSWRRVTDRIVVS
ncbi:MAG: ribonuclease III [Rhizobiales bacterium PAR1]|nr:MAG: ribonuclease III [Rhizobiales bacterium PAR1]